MSGSRRRSGTATGFDYNQTVYAVNENQGFATDKKPDDESQMCQLVISANEYHLRRLMARMNDPFDRLLPQANSPALPSASSRHAFLAHREDIVSHEYNQSLIVMILLIPTAQPQSQPQSRPPPPPPSQASSSSTHHSSDAQSKERYGLLQQVLCCGHVSNDCNTNIDNSNSNSNYKYNNYNYNTENSNSYSRSHSHTSNSSHEPPPGTENVAELQGVAWHPYYAQPNPDYESWKQIKHENSGNGAHANNDIALSSRDALQARMKRVRNIIKNQLASSATTPTCGLDLADAPHTHRTSGQQQTENKNEQ